MTTPTTTNRTGATMNTTRRITSPLEWITGADNNLYRLDARPTGRILVQRDHDGMTWVVGMNGVCMNRRNALDTIVLEAATSYATKV